MTHRAVPPTCCHHPTPRVLAHGLFMCERVACPRFSKQLISQVWMVAVLRAGSAAIRVGKTWLEFSGRRHRSGRANAFPSIGGWPVPNRKHSV